jgi:WD40 repeat protein
MECIVLNPSGRSYCCRFGPWPLLLVGGHWGTLHVWNVCSQLLVFQLSGHSLDHLIVGCDVMRDGWLAVSACTDKLAILWDLQQGIQLRSLKHNDCVRCCALSHDGTRAVTGSDDKTVRLWDVDTGTKTHDLACHTGIVTSCEFAPNGRLVLTGSTDGMAMLWDAAAGTLLRILCGHVGTVCMCVFPGESARILTASWDNSVKMWRTIDGRCLSTLTTNDGGIRSERLAVCAAVSPDRLTLATCNHTRTDVCLWDACTGQPLPTLQGEQGTVACCAFSPDGRVLATAGDKVCVWELPPGRQRRAGVLVLVLEGNRQYRRGRRLPAELWELICREFLDAHNTQAVV